ncbi:hypothetical protein D3C87_1556280 [compost metagenome]
MGSGRVVTAPLHMNGGDGNLDTVFVECLLDHDEGTPSDGELHSGLGHELEPQNDCKVAEAVHPLHLQRLQCVRGEFWISGKVLTDLLDEFPRQFNIGVIGHINRHLVDHPVTAQVLDCSELPERNREDGTTMVPEPDGPQAE